MTNTENPTSHFPLSLTKRMLIGASIGLAFILVFLLPINPDPAWGKLWMIRPLIIVPFAGAMGGLCNYYIMSFYKIVGVNKFLAIGISILVCLIGLWLGFVLGLDGTLWN